MLTKGAYNWVSKYLKYVVDMVENGEILFFLKKWWNGKEWWLKF